MIVRKIIIHHHCAQAWPTSQAWWSRRIKLITEYKIEFFGTKEMFNKREYSKWPQYRLRLKFCPVHTVLLTSAHAKNGDYAAMLPRQNRVTTRWQRSCSIILHAVHGEFAANFAPVRIGQMRRKMCRQNWLRKAVCRSSDDSRSSDSGSESLRCALIVITVVKVLYNCTITIVRVLLSNYCSVLTVLLLMRWLRWLRSSGTIRTAGPSSATSGKSGALCISDHARRIARRRGTQCHQSGPMMMIRHAISL